MQVDRVIGRYRADRPGPSVVVTAGVHGNEPAGVVAARRVLARLEAERCPVRGEFVALAGNVAALARGVRFVDRDLNRCWLDEEAGARGVEERELRDLRAAMDTVPRPRIVLDLHTTSGTSPPFTLMSDVRRNRRIAFALPAPVILGLEESVDGTLLEYATEQGDTAIVVETGRHDAPASVDIAEATIWQVLVAAGALEPGEVSGLAAWRARLAAACRGLPRVVEVRYRHALVPGDGFVMEPGHAGLGPVRRGQVVAHDRQGPVAAPASGRLLMPLYQRQGDDGFFVVRRVSRFWLWVSALLRSLKADRLVPLLPGVRRHPARANSLLVDPRVARVAVVGIFHLFGFRKRRPEGRMLVFTRRRPG